MIAALVALPGFLGAATIISTDGLGNQGFAWGVDVAGWNQTQYRLHLERHREYRRALSARNRRAEQFRGRLPVHSQRFGGSGAREPGDGRDWAPWMRGAHSTI